MTNRRKFIRQLSAASVLSSIPGEFLSSAFDQFTDTVTPQAYFLAQAGQPKALIVIGKESAPFYRWVAEEVQHYLQELTGAVLPIISSDDISGDKPCLALGGPMVNPLSEAAEQKQLVNFAGLEPEGFIIQTIDIDAQPTVVIGGNNEASTMYAAYEFLERLGMAFQITGDIIPQSRPDLKLPDANVRMESALKNRGLHIRHFVMPWMGLDDFRRLIDQMAKLKFNYLEFFWYVGGPWDEYSYRGEKRQIDTLYTKNSGYLTFHLTAGSYTAKDVKIGRKHFRQERVCAPEFATVLNQDQAHEVARAWLKEAIAYAHKRKIKIWLGQGDCPQVTPNMKKFSPKATDFDFLTYAEMSPGDSVGAEIWEAMFSSMIDTYPEADGYWIWLSEGGVYGTEDLETQKVLKQYDVDGKRTEADSDLALVHYGKELIQRLRSKYPQIKVGLAVLNRCNIFQLLDKFVPKDVPFMSMESGACWHKGIPVPMEHFGGLAPRETYLVPRLDDDAHELAMQFNVALYEFDRVLTGSVKYNLTGVAPQTGKLRGLEQNARYLADGAWNPQLTTAQFYETYLSSMYGEDALQETLKAYQILQENERTMGWRGNYNFYNYTGPIFIPPIGPLSGAVFESPFLRYSVNPLIQDAPPKANWNAPHMNREAFSSAIPRLDEAVKYLEYARTKVSSGALKELDYIIFKTLSFSLHLKVLCAWLDCISAYERVIKAKLKQDKTEALQLLDQCRSIFLTTRSIIRKSAKFIADRVEDPDEKYILFRYNIGIVTPMEKLCKEMAKWAIPNDFETSPK